MLGVELEPELVDKVELGLQEVDVILGVPQDFLKDLATDVVLRDFALGDAGNQRGAAARLQGEIRRQSLHRGLAERNFERRFQLADYVVVTDAQLADGLLSIHLKRELPESLKPRRIEINTAPAAPAIEVDADKAA